MNNGQGYNQDIPMGGEETRVISFVAPGAINGTPVLGVDTKTQNTFFNLATINSIIRAIENSPQGAADSYVYSIERDGYLIRDLYSDLVKPEIQGPIFPGLPLNLTPAQYQIRMVQVAGAVAARNLSLVFQKSLA